MSNFNILNTTVNTSAKLQGFTDFKELPLEFIASYFKGVKGVKRGGKLILDENVTDKKASEIQDVWQFVKKGLVYTTTQDPDDFRYSSHEFGIEPTTGKLVVTTTGKAFGSCHYDCPTDSYNEYGSAKKAVNTMYIVFTKDGQYYGRFYVYNAIAQGVETDIIDGAYINERHTERKNQNEPRLSALVYSHNNSIKRSQVKKMSTACEYFGQGYANPANDYAYYLVLNEGIDNDIQGYQVEIESDDDNCGGRECERCCDVHNEDEMYYCDRDDSWLCGDCMFICHACEEVVSEGDTSYCVNDEWYCESCVQVSD